MASALFQRIRRIWATLGSVAFLGFVLWCLVAYRAAPAAQTALVSDSLVAVAHAPNVWAFLPTHTREPRVNVLFLSGALVDPIAYAPLLRQISQRGYPTYLHALPLRGAFGRADGADFLEALRAFTDTIPGTWVLAGHSRGAKIAALVARQPTSRMAGLILLGSTHPRDFSLADSRLAVTKLYGTKDGVAPVADVLGNRHLLPATTHWVPIDGGNHNQFGYYGFQPGDHWASISRAAQQEATLRAILVALASLDAI